MTNKEAREKRIRAMYADNALTALCLTPRCDNCGHFISDETPGALCEECQNAEESPTNGDN